ncbi:DNA polymerase alpha/primase associated subunit [Lepidopterella palustris CBS 459.81]|uniref:DNA polymerase alpha subunit B n=1 Tax=Lepidopterella palustris CBS 459.81 TaxID=1314670 RepID=A0A8E2JFL2_9PEZI|nr:DNA polymerase alpha/primase associated subunit [Lepidopterella palustris CBS 459.81]
MDDSKIELNERFGHYAGPHSELRPEVLGELQSILRLYSISAEELFFKWEAYSMKMGGDETTLDLKTARDFKKDIQDVLERERRGKAHAGNNQKKVGAPTPRTGGKGSDVFEMLDGLVPNTPRPGALKGVDGSTTKRKSNFETPAAKVSKNHAMSSPNGVQTPLSSLDVNRLQTFSFAGRENAGQIVEQVNGHIELPEAPEEPPTASRIKMKANTDMAKFSYKTMAMKLSEASEVLDDRIDEFLALVQDHHELENTAFGNPANQSTNEIIAVGRIASDSSEGRLNAASLVLETSRRTGAGLRVPLHVESLQSYNFFPGQIVALRGSNASGDFFSVNEVLSLPLLPLPATNIEDMDACNARLLDTPSSDPSSPRPLNVLIASGPYTTDTSLDYSPLHALLDNAVSTVADALILTGPFIDAEHPLIRTGSFDLPPTATNPDRATLSDLFRHHISSTLQEFSARLPTCSVILVPSLRDALSRHAAYPQDKFPKRELGLPRQVLVVTNPMTLTMNEFVVGMSSVDVLDMLRREECVGGKAKSTNVLERNARAIIEQRSFLPLFPPTARESLPAVTVASVGEKCVGAGEGEEEIGAPNTFLPLGAMVDTSYLKLGEWLNVLPDVLVCPSVLNPFVKVVAGVIVINPGPLAKRRAAGTYARMVVLPMVMSHEERERGEGVGNRMYDRARVDVVKV